MREVGGGGHNASKSSPVKLLGVLVFLATTALRTNTELCVPRGGGSAAEHHIRLKNGKEGQENTRLLYPIKYYDLNSNANGNSVLPNLQIFRTESYKLTA